MLSECCRRLRSFMATRVAIQDVQSQAQLISPFANFRLGHYCSASRVAGVDASGYKKGRTAEG